MPSFRLELTEEEHSKLNVLKAHTKKKSFKQLILWMADQTIRDMGLHEKPVFTVSKPTEKQEE